MSYYIKYADENIAHLVRMNGRGEVSLYLDELSEFMQDDNDPLNGYNYDYNNSNIVLSDDDVYKILRLRYKSKHKADKDKFIIPVVKPSVCDSKRGIFADVNILAGASTRDSIVLTVYITIEENFNGLVNAVRVDFLKEIMARIDSIQSTMGIIKHYRVNLVYDIDTTFVQEITVSPNLLHRGNMYNIIIDSVVFTKRCNFRGVRGVNLLFADDATAKMYNPNIKIDLSHLDFRNIINMDYLFKDFLGEVIYPELLPVNPVSMSGTFSGAVMDFSEGSNTYKFLNRINTITCASDIMRDAKSSKKGIIPFIYLPEKFLLNCINASSSLSPYIETEVFISLTSELLEAGLKSPALTADIIFSSDAVCFKISDNINITRCDFTADIRVTSPETASMISFRINYNEDIIADNKKLVKEKDNILGELSVLYNLIELYQSKNHEKNLLISFYSDSKLSLYNTVLYALVQNIGRKFSPEIIDSTFDMPYVLRFGRRFSLYSDLIKQLRVGIYRLNFKWDNDELNFWVDRIE